MAEGLVRVWAEPDLKTQHLATPPADDTTHHWAGVTTCGLEADLSWVFGEQVDTGMACAACTAAAGVSPPLEGDHPGPV